MVDASSVLDPHKPQRVTLSEEELLEAQAHIAEGLLPADWLERYREEQARNVFGDDHLKDRNGTPIEQGLGSAINQTKNSVEAYRRWRQSEPGFERHLALMERQLEEFNQRRAKERASAPKHGRIK